MELVKTDGNHSHKLPEESIIRRIIAGEKELYEILIRRNNQKLYRMVRSYIKDESEIEDIMQNTYLKAYEKLYQFKFHSSYSTWLLRIGINESLIKIKEKSRMFVMDPDFNQNQKKILEIPDPEGFNPENKLIQAEMKQILEKSIDELEQKYKSIYILKEVEKMPMKEIAECLGISVGNVKVRYHRAKNMLKDKLYSNSVNEGIFEYGYSKCDRLTERIMKLIC